MIEYVNEDGLVDYTQGVEYNFYLRAKFFFFMNFREDIRI